MLGKKLLAAAITAGLVAGATSALACTTILAGPEATVNGAYIVSRTVDAHDPAVDRAYFLFRPRKEGRAGFASTADNDFTWEPPEVSLAYAAMPQNARQGWGETGFNECGVGISSTETIFPSDEALRLDPFVEKTGMDEAGSVDAILPAARTAREGIERAGKLIEKHGAAEGYGITLVDKDGIWYLEVAGGHRWIAAKLPKDACFITANQGRLRDYDPNDKENYMGSADVIDFARRNKLYKPGEKFDFNKVFMNRKEYNKDYNHPRVERLQELLMGHKVQGVYPDGDTYPVFLRPGRKVSVAKIKEMQRDHYTGTPGDPYETKNTNTRRRVTSVFRAQLCHVLEVRPGLPQAIGMVNYISMGMSDLGVYIPYYQGMKRAIPEFSHSGDQYDDSAYWRFRGLQTLVMQDYPRYAPAVKKAYAEFEAATEKKQAEMEQRYLQTYRSNPAEAERILQDFEDETMRGALALTDKLTKDVITGMMKQVNAAYPFMAQKNGTGHSDAGK